MRGPMATRRSTSAIAGAFAALEYAYGGALLLMEACRAALPQWLPSIVLGTYRFYLYLPALVLAAVVVVDRRWRRHALSLLMAAVFLASYGGQFLPRLPAATESGITVLTLNVENAKRGREEARAFIVRARPDIIGLQEIDGRNALLQDLRDAGYEVRHRPYRGGRGQGIAIASRPPCRLGDEIAVPPHASGRWTLLAHEIEYDAGDGVRTFNAVVCHLASFGLQGAPHQNVAAHLASVRRASPWQLADTEALLERVAAFRDPTILLGDFNSTPEQELHRRIRRTMTDAWLARGYGYGGTRTFVLPLRIDYVYATEHFRVLAARRGPAGLSDHRPVKVVLDVHG